MVFVVQSLLCPTLCNPMDCSMPGFPVLHYHLPKFARTRVHLVGDAIQNHLICHLLLSSVFPSIRVFSNESALHIRWPVYWSFSFSIGLSNECSALISLRIDWFDLKKTHKSLLQHHNSKPSVLQYTAFFCVSPALTSVHDYEQNHCFSHEL